MHSGGGETVVASCCLFVLSSVSPSSLLRHFSPFSCISFHYQLHLSFSPSVSRSRRNFQHAVARFSVFLSLFRVSRFLIAACPPSFLRSFKHNLPTLLSTLCSACFSPLRLVTAILLSVLVLFCSLCAFCWTLDIRCAVCPFLLSFYCHLFPPPQFFSLLPLCCLLCLFLRPHSSQWHGPSSWSKDQGDPPRPLRVTSVAHHRAVAARANGVFPRRV